MDRLDVITWMSESSSSVTCSFLSTCLLFLFFEVGVCGLGLSLLLLDSMASSAALCLLARRADDTLGFLGFVLYGWTVSHMLPLELFLTLLIRSCLRSSRLSRSSSLWVRFRGLLALLFFVRRLSTEFMERRVPFSMEISVKASMERASLGIWTASS